MKKFGLSMLLLAYSFSMFSQVIPEHPQQDSFSQVDSVESAPVALKKDRRLWKNYLVPVSFLATGILTESLPCNTALSKEGIQKHIQDRTGGFRTSADNYLQFVPLGTMFGISLAGSRGRNDLLNQAILTAKSELLMSVFVYSMKYWIHDTRPDGSSDNSMPSGHTAQAFLSATLLDMEYRDKYPWVCVGGYLCASLTGYLRMVNNRHWVSDVCIGACIGIASVKTVYLTHKTRWSGKQNAMIMPFLLPGGGGISASVQL